MVKHHLATSLEEALAKIHLDLRLPKTTQALDNLLHGIQDLAIAIEKEKTDQQPSGFQSANAMRGLSQHNTQLLTIGRVRQPSPSPAAVTGVKHARPDELGQWNRTTPGPSGGAGGGMGGRSEGAGGDM